MENYVKDNKNKKRSGNMGTAIMVIAFLLLTIPFFQVDFFVASVGWAGKAYTGCQIIAGCAVLLLLFKDRLLKRLSPLLLLFAALLFVMCLSTGFTGGSIKTVLGYSFAVLAMSLVVEYGILKDIRSFLIAQMIFFGTLTAVNFLTVILFPGGLYKYLSHYTDTWFLGFKSGHISYQLAFIFFSVMFFVICDKKKRFIPLTGIALSLASNILVKNTTATVILIPLAIVIAIPPILKFTKVMNILVYTAVGVFFQLVIVVFRRQDIFAWFITGVLHKRLDLTRRINIWDMAIGKIEEQPVTGHGYQDFVFSERIVTTHNEFLEILYKTGFIGLIIFLLILGIVIYRLFKNRKMQAAMFTAFFTGTFFIMFMVEQYAFVYFFYIFLFAFRSGELEELYKQQVSESGIRKTQKDHEAGRTAKSARNVLFAAAANGAAIIIGLLAQRLFIHILGLEYAGLNGLFSNVLTMLAIADLGIGEAVIFHLYKPLKEKDNRTIVSLMRFYRKAFHIVAGVIAATGVCLIPALPFIAHTDQANVNLTVVYLIFLADVVFSYFLSYKRAILYADQKNFIISAVHMAYLLGMNLAQLLVLYFTHNYYVYILTKLAFRILENVVITMIADRQYQFLKTKRVVPLKKDILKDIKKKVGALVFHKIGTFVVNGTDNILISVFLSLVTAGLYNNYYMVIDAATKLINPAIGALTPGVGNLLISEDIDHRYLTFRRIRFMNFWIASFAATVLFIMVQPFVSLWFGEEYVLPVAVVIMLTIQFFQFLMRATYNVFQDGAGIFYENRFVPIFESAINLAASLILLQFFGLAGVFAGTIISSMALWCFSYPKYVYTKLFKRSIKNYVLETLGYAGMFAVVISVTTVVVRLISNAVSLEGIPFFVLSGILSLLIPNALMALIFFKTDCFRYFVDLIKRRL